MKAISPVTLAVLKGRLEQIADEMDATLYRSAFNPIIAEARDACHDGAWHRTSVFDRLKLPVDAMIEGPAILEQADATTIVDPGLKATVDRFGNVIMERA